MDLGPKIPSDPYGRPRWELRRGGARKVGRMSVKMSVERKSPDPSSKTGGGVLRVARSLNFIVKKGALATEPKRATCPACVTKIRGE